LIVKLIVSQLDDAEFNLIGIISDDPELQDAYKLHSVTNNIFPKMALFGIMDTWREQNHFYLKNKICGTLIGDFGFRYIVGDCGDILQPFRLCTA
jgi:hypothetical protein